MIDCNELLLGLRLTLDIIKYCTIFANSPKTFYSDFSSIFMTLVQATLFHNYFFEECIRLRIIF